MNVLPILTSVIETERDVVLARRRAWQLAEPLGFDPQERTRIATSVSEIARNAFKYAGGGRVEFSIESDIDAFLVIVVSDNGPGIGKLDEILRGNYVSATGMGLGLIGARRLMDSVKIDTSTTGTSVRMHKRIPYRSSVLGAREVGAIAAELARNTVLDPNEEVHRQNRELMTMLQELQRRQDELERLNRELEDTNRGVVALYAELDERAERLRQADEIKTRFLSHMSHEFRTPLSSILALSRLLLDRVDGDLTSEQEKQISYIKSSAHELSELVNDLLDLAKVEAGRITINIETFAIEQLFGSLRGVMRPLVTSETVSLSFRVSGGPFTMTSDEGKIGQILRNLISNALKFTERGDVWVTAKVNAQDDRVIFTVNDTGIGIAEGDAETIFEEYGQIDNPVQRVVKGTGLGLPLSRRLAQLLGGTLTVTSTPGTGSCFTLTLPRTINDAAPSA